MTPQHLETWMAQVFMSTPLALTKVSQANATLQFSHSCPKHPRYRIRQIQAQYEFDAYEEQIQVLNQSLNKASFEPETPSQWPGLFAQMLREKLPLLWFVMDEQGHSIAVMTLLLDEQDTQVAQIQILNNLEHCTLLSIVVAMLTGVDYGFGTLGLREIQVQFGHLDEDLSHFLGSMGFRLLTLPDEQPFIYALTASQYYYPIRKDASDVSWKKP